MEIIIFDFYFLYEFKVGIYFIFGSLYFIGIIVLREFFCFVVKLVIVFGI